MSSDEKISFTIVPKLPDSSGQHSSGQRDSEPKKSSTIKYINSVVPKVKLPAYSGQREAVLVPDTLDLQDMAGRAVNGLTAPTDPKADYEVYWLVTFNSNPPYMVHAESDIVQAKFMESLPLLRVASGSDQNRQVEKRWMEVMRQMQGPDGLIYMPRKGRPWCISNYGILPPGDHYTVPWFVGRIINAMTIYFLLTGEEAWKESARRAVDGLNNLAVHQKNKSHFPWHQFGVGGKFVKHDPALAIHNPATYHSWALQGLANYYRHTGYQPALKLASGIARWIEEDSNHSAADGRFLPEYPNSPGVHFHGHTMVLLAMLEYGIAANDKKAISYARRGFEYALTQGECLLGYFREWVNLPLATTHNSTLELCELADMIALALKLSKCGAGDYWDMADRWIRNLFYEGQLRRSEWVYWQADKLAPSRMPAYHTADKVIERNIGAFGSHLLPNDFVYEYPFDGAWPTPGIAHCCTGNATRTIFYAWENVLTYRNGSLRVNLLLNRASRWIDVNSHIPYAGQVDVRIKEPVNLSIRIPEWVKPEETKCTVNEQGYKLTWYGRYAIVGKVKPKDAVTLTFPIRERSEYVYVEKRCYRILLRGNTCVAIDPPGKKCQLFQREHYRENETRWRKRDRFISDRQIDW